MLDLTQIYSIISQYQYLIIFPIVAIEGPIATVIAGFLSAQGMMNPFIVYPIIVVGDLVGDVFYYSIGRWWSNVDVKYGWLLGITSAKVKKMEKHFIHHSGKTLLIGKLAHGIGGVFIFAAGISRMSLNKFVYYNFIATVPKSLILLLIGYYFGESYVSIDGYFNHLAMALGLLFVFVILGYYAKLRFFDSESD